MGLYQEHLSSGLSYVTHSASLICDVLAEHIPPHSGIPEGTASPQNFCFAKLTTYFKMFSN